MGHFAIVSLLKMITKSANYHSFRNFEICKKKLKSAFIEFVQRKKKVRDRDSDDCSLTMLY